MAPQQPVIRALPCLDGGLVLRQGCGWPGGTQQTRAQGWVCDPRAGLLHSAHPIHWGHTRRPRPGTQLAAQARPEMAGTEAETCDGGPKGVTCVPAGVSELFSAPDGACSGPARSPAGRWRKHAIAGLRDQHGEWGPWAPGRLAGASRACVCATSLLTASPVPLPGALRSHWSSLARAGPGGTQRAPPQGPVRLTSFRLCSGTSLKVQRLDSALPWQGAQVRSLLRELRPHVPHNVAKKKEKYLRQRPPAQASPTSHARAPGPPHSAPLFRHLPASVSTQCPQCLHRQHRSSNGLRSVPLSPGPGAEPGRGLLPKPCQPEDLFTE